MFDYSPNEDVPWFDGSLARLYSYFEDNPELWSNAGLFLKVRIVLFLLFCVLFLSVPLFHCNPCLCWMV